MKHCISLSVFVSLSILVGAGCGRVQRVYLNEPGLLDAPGFSRLDHVSATPGVQELKGQTLAVELLPTSQTLSQESFEAASVDWAEWQADYENILADAMYQTLVFRDVSAPSDYDPLEDPDLRLAIAITEWDEGNGWLRLLLGFGLGRTRVQWEGLLRDMETGRTVMVFADAREHPGGPSIFGLGQEVMHGAPLIAEDLRWALADLQDALREFNEVETPKRSRYFPHPKARVAPAQSEGDEGRAEQENGESEMMQQGPALPGGTPGERQPDIPPIPVSR